MSLSEENIF